MQPGGPDLCQNPSDSSFRFHCDGAMFNSRGLSGNVVIELIMVIQLPETVFLHRFFQPSTTYTKPIIGYDLTFFGVSMKECLPQRTGLGMTLLRPRLRFKLHFAIN